MRVPPLSGLVPKGATVAEYTPTTDGVRNRYIKARVSYEPGAEFDRWLAARDREVAAQAWDEGRWAFRGQGTPWPANPYRSGTEAETGDTHA